MAIEIVMPRLGWTMEEGVLVEWLKRDGDAVQVGDIMFTVESDKALNEVEAFDSGILRIPPDSPPPGAMIPVGGLLAYLVQPSESAPFELTPAAKLIEPPPYTGSAPQTPASAESKTGLHRRPAISPRARRIAQDLGIDWTQLKGSGRTARIIERDVLAVFRQQTTTEAKRKTVGAIDASPVARRAAQELGVDLAEVGAQLPGRRITRQDVEQAAVARPLATQEDKRVPLSHIRAVIAERLSASAHTTAPVTLTTEADATELVRLRQQLKSDEQAAAKSMPSYNDLLMKLTAAALQEHPMLNARIEGDTIVQSPGVHIGLAVDSERGLLVPVVRDVPSKSLRQIAGETIALIERARAGSLKPDELTGSTFSITNLGMYDIDAFTPIINLPECAILGIGRIVPKLVVVDVDSERTAIRHMLFLSLTFDHRLVDGAPAARFLQRVKQYVEHPYLWLVD